MAVLSESTRKKYFKALSLGEYNAENIRKLQKKYMRASDVDGIYGTDTDRLLRHVYNCSLVKNFEPEEFKCTCRRCTGYPSYMKQVELNHIQTIRDHYGKPMQITSGLRCSYENKKVGGVSNSGHLTGYAVDFYMKGVTDTIPHRNGAMQYIKMLPNHEYTYGSCIVDSNGVYKSAPGMGNAMHTETHKPEVSAIVQKELDACPVQADWMKDSIYKWEKDPTVPKSKYKGTCVTYVACVLQRIGILASGKYIWHTDKGKVAGDNSKMTVIYPNKKLSQIKNQLKAGDIIMDGDKYDTGGGSHIFIFTGKWSGNKPIIWDNHSGQQGKNAYAYSRNRYIIAIVRLK